MKRFDGIMMAVGAMLVYASLVCVIAWLVGFAVGRMGGYATMVVRDFGCLPVGIIILFAIGSVCQLMELIAAKGMRLSDEEES